MLCPQCQSEMKVGYIPANYMKMQWIPEEESAPWTRAGLARGAVQLTPLTLFTNSRALAYWCPQCDWVILPRQAKVE